MRWKAANPSKTFAESFMLFYSLVWMGIVTVIVNRKWYLSFSPNDFITCGLTLLVPCITAPLLLAGKEERSRPISQRYIVKANIFIAIVSYIGNHFYTHYFYNVLGVRYTGPLGEGEGLEINKVPVSMFLMTHVYFMTYHVLVTPCIRAVKSLFSGKVFQCMGMGLFILLTAVFTAFAESWTISNFPYYTYPDLNEMLTKGSIFYGTYFVVTFPWFFRMDEDPEDLWSIHRVIVEAFAAMMVVLLCADIWRLCLFDTPYAKVMSF